MRNLLQAFNARRQAGKSGVAGLAPSFGDASQGH
jgi:hypothetical protein